MKYRPLLGLPIVSKRTGGCENRPDFIYLFFSLSGRGQNATTIFSIRSIEHSKLEIRVKHDKNGNREYETRMITTPNERLNGLTRR